MRRPALGLAALMLTCAAPAPADDTLPAYRARMYARPAKDAWQGVLDTLAELRLKPDKIEADTQMVVTRAASYGSGTLKGPEMPGYDPLRFQLHVFVSPYAEPARVHVGSVSHLRKLAGGTSTLYNGGAAEEWFLAALERRLALQGRPIPVDADARARLASELSGQEPCRQEAQAKGEGIEEPRKIKASHVELVYPGPARRERSSGPVVLELNVGEDGAVYGMLILKLPDPELQFRESALGATSLVRYVPARLRGCAVPMIMTYTVNYRLR